jgi:hypothetical protein
MFERHGGGLDPRQGQKCEDNSALHLDGSLRRPHCAARIEKILAWSIFLAVFVESRAARNPI